MSSFLKQGLRQQKQKNKREVRKRIKAIYQIMEELDEVAQNIILKEGEVIDENNIEEIASKYTDRKIEGYEKMILLSKLESIGKVDKENILKDETKTDIQT